MNDALPYVGLVLEQTLGHVTHAANLRRLIAADGRILARFAPIEFEVTGWRRRVPLFATNWTVRAGLRARGAIRTLQSAGPLDALFVHTQVPAILCPDRLRRIPTVVSLDATPIQYDELGQHYEHGVGSPRAERLKWQANRLCFRRAAAIVTWAHWTKRGLVDRYEVPPEKVIVIPPGVDIERWDRPAPTDRGSSGAVAILFVGGDLRRKGGDLLVAAVRRLRSEGLPVELHLVTRDAVASEPGVHVHRGLTANSPALIDRYRSADIFCLPTLGDCLPMVLPEAGAMRLPLVSTDVGAIREVVRPDETGVLVPVGDEAALVDGLRRLVVDQELRRRLGGGARQLVAAEHDAASNAHELVDVLIDVVRSHR